MIKFYPFDERFRCDIWVDNEVLRFAEEESAELFRSNWNEILYLLNRVRILENYIVSIGGTVPPAYPDNDE